LEAYGCNGERQTIPVDGGDFYVSFEHKCLFKLIDILNDRNMSFDELYRTCDVNGDGDIKVDELESVIGTISEEFYTKDIHALHKFFDMNVDNVITEQEFISQLNKA
jgi:Ca2+-binding EF-hand superfamily protein